MTARSWLFVPGDSPSKIEKALGSGADAVILDLEDSVAPASKAAARDGVAQILRRPRAGGGPQLWVRVNPLTTTLALEDLAAIVVAAPDGVVLPKAEGAGDIERLDHYLEALEAGAGRPIGATSILPISTETPRALFKLDSYAQVAGRLAGLTWGAEDLPSAVGASINHGSDGAFTDLCRLARTLCLAGAAAADVSAIETVYPAFRDFDGLRAYADLGRKEGFGGMLAIHPAQVEIINAAFTPSEAEIGHAQQVLEAFRQGAGVISLDGQMLDAPHLKQAQRILALVAPKEVKG